MWANSQLEAQIKLVTDDEDETIVQDTSPADLHEIDVDACEELSQAIKTFIFRHEEHAKQAAAVLDISQVLRRAMAIKAADLDPLVVQLGHDYDRSRRYLVKEAIRWVQGDDLSDLFALVELPGDTAAAVREVLTTAFPLESLAVWMCEEFGHLRASRHANHSRRYVAAKLTSHILGYTGRGTATGRLDPSVAQAKFDKWADPVCEIEQSLHYQRVVAPVCARLIEIGEAARLHEEKLVAANTNEASE